MPYKGACSSPDPPSTSDAADESWAASCLRNSADGDDEDPITPGDPYDSIPQPANILEMLSAEVDAQPEETEISGVSAFRNPFLPGAAEYPPWDSEDAENPNSPVAVDAAVEAEDESDIFRVWDLNTENLQLESGTLTEIFKSSFDSPELFNSPPPPPSADALDLRVLNSALDESEDLDNLIADMADLNISVSGKRRNHSK